MARPALLPLLALLLPLAASRTSPPIEEIDLDQPPAERWLGVARRYRHSIIARGKGMGKMFQVALGEDVAKRWVKGAQLDADLRAEYESIVRAVNHSEVTLDRLVISDMWQAVNSPVFGCTGLLAAMPNGTVIHGRNIDYDTMQVAKEALITGAGLAGNEMIDCIFKKGGKPVGEFLALAGSLGTHTGMRFGAYSVNSNARLKNNAVADNLRAHEAGARNFPWELRRMLETVGDFDSAVAFIEDTKLNAPNYFIFAGSGPYQGAIVTKDRLGTHEPSTPPTQRLDAAKGVWHIVQTNDDLESPPEDARRGAALVRLSNSVQSEVDMDFVQREMEAPPVMNSDTLLTWVANPSAGTHRVISRPESAIAQGLLEKLVHRALDIPMPQDLPRKRAEATLRGSLLTE